MAYNLDNHIIGLKTSEKTIVHNKCHE